jgi:MinD-like ATPase involved in chromosome partitioning or flagellar assembly
MELGSLNINIYKCITSHIDTDRVIITDNQLDHIAEHHPDAYDETLIELKSTLSNPDYIFKDTKHNDTGLVVKAIKNGDTYLYIVLKVCTNSNGGKLANSVISGWKISESRLNNYLRNKKLLYKKS